MTMSTISDRQRPASTPIHSGSNFEGSISSRTTTAVRAFLARERANMSLTPPPRHSIVFSNGGALVQGEDTETDEEMSEIESITDSEDSDVDDENSLPEFTVQSFLVNR